MGEGGAIDGPVTRLLRAHPLVAPDDFVDAITFAVAEMGGTDVVLFVVDYAQVELTPHPAVLPHGEPAIASMDGSMAGRAFTSQEALAAERADGWHVWVPVSDRADRLGVLAMTVPAWDEQIATWCTDLGLAVAPLFVCSAQYTDLPHLLRRRQRVDLAAEMQWALLPPLSFAAAGASLAGVLEPAYEVGGDCFDYAYNAGVLDVAIFDVMGHGLRSAVIASLVVGAYRHARRRRGELAELARAVDAAVRTQPGDVAFATALLARVDVASGRLTWLSCGHPQPLIVRRGAVLDPATFRPGVPLGLGSIAPVVGDVVEASLEPGDGVLFYTDGVVEARTRAGVLFEEEQLRDLLGREHVAAASPQEVIRRLVRTAIEHSYDQGRQDDASMVYLHWDPTRSDPVSAGCEGQVSGAGVISDQRSSMDAEDAVDVGEGHPAVGRRRGDDQLPDELDLGTESLVGHVAQVTVGLHQMNDDRLIWGQTEL